MDSFGLLDVSLARFSEKLSKGKSLRMIETQEPCSTHTKQVNEQTTNNNNRNNSFLRSLYLYLLMSHFV